MGLEASKELLSLGKKKIDEACSNTSLSRLRYVAVEKPKWKVFGKRELRPITTYPVKGRRGCPCGANGPCKQKITPKGVVLHYPQKNKIFDKKYKPPKIEKAFLTDKDRVIPKTKIVRPKRFPVPTWRVDKMMSFTPFQNIQKCRRRRQNRAMSKGEDSDSENNSDVEDNTAKEEKK